MSKHFIIYSHGFGVEKSDRGLFTDIANSLTDFQHIMFDYNKIDNINNTLSVTTLREQSKLLTEIINNTFKHNPNATIDMVCHSMGCITAALSMQTAIRKTIFLAPPETLDAVKFSEIFNREGSKINIGGESTLMRNDGSITIVSKDFWSGIKNLNPVQLYNRFNKNTDLTIVEATEDEVLGITDFSHTDDTIKLESMMSDHNFTDTARKEVISLIDKILS